MPDLQEVLRIGARRSLVPIRGDGSKKPPEGVGWKRRQEERADARLLTHWFGGPDPHPGVGIVCGQVSGHLECIDFDTAAYFEPFREAVERVQPGLIGRLAIQQTPRPGYQLLYCSEEPVSGNQKLAQQQVGVDEHGRPKLHTDVETRGEGGYFLCYLSASCCHETGRPYQLIQGDLADLAVITAEERLLLLTEARAFNLYLEPRRRVTHECVKLGPADRHDPLEPPGAVFNRLADWHALLEAEGAKLETVRGDAEYWVRPGKDRGHSASLHAVAPGVLNVFTNNWWPLQAEHGYDAFGFLCATKFNGDYSACARYLADQGYGAPKIRANGKHPDPYRAQALPANGAVPVPAVELPVEPAVEPLLKQYTLRDRSQLKARPDPVYQIENFTVDGGITSLYGLSGSAKSFVLVDLLMSTIADIDWLGRKVLGGNVVIVNSDGGSGLKKRLVAWEEVNGELTPYELYCPDEEVNLFDPGDVRAFAVAMEKVQPRIIAFDTLAECAVGADEISTKDQSFVIRGIKHLRSVTGAQIILVHHSTKDGVSMRGVASLYNASSTVIRVVKDGDVIVLSCDKQRDFEAFLPIQMNMVRHGSSCVLVPSDARLARSQKPAERAKENLLHLIAECEQTALTRRDESLRADMNYLLTRTCYNESNVKRWLKQLSDEGSIYWWDRKLEGLNTRRYVFGIICKGESDCRRDVGVL